MNLSSFNYSNEVNIQSRPWNVYTHRIYVVRLAY